MTMLPIGTDLGELEPENRLADRLVRGDCRNVLAHSGPMWPRILGAPWWVRWLVNAAVIAATLTFVTVLLYPNVFTITGPRWGLLGIAGFGLIIAAAALFAQHPLHQRLAEAMSGLNREQRDQAYKALRHSEIPGDPRVLAAAITVGAIVVAALNRALRGVNVLAWLVPALFTVSAVAAFVAGDTRHGIFSIGCALYMPSYYAWVWYRKRQLTRHLESLRAVASEREIPADTDALVTPPARRWWALIPLLIAIGVAVSAIAYLSTRPAPGCRTADAAINLNLNADLAEWPERTSEPDLARYRNWSDQLQTYARQASTTAAGDPLHRIADLSVQAVALLQDIHRDESAGAATDVIIKSKTAYLNTITRMLAEQKDLQAICHSHR